MVRKEHRRLYQPIEESLDSIVLGLNPSPQDRVLASGCCGDAGFALLSQAGSVHMVDISQSSATVIPERIKALKSHSFEDFIYTSEGKRDTARDQWFEDKWNLIYDNRNNVSFSNTNIYHQEETFDHCYMSLYYCIIGLQDVESFPEELEHISRSILSGGRIYDALFGLYLCATMKYLNPDIPWGEHESENQELRDNALKYMFSRSGLTIDEERTQIAQSKNTFFMSKPGIYKVP